MHPTKVPRAVVFLDTEFFTKKKMRGKWLDNGWTTDEENARTMLSQWFVNQVARMYFRQ